MRRHVAPMRGRQRPWERITAMVAGLALDRRAAEPRPVAASPAGGAATSRPDGKTPARPHPHLARRLRAPSEGGSP
jgi:hypothetical protein